VDGRMTANLLWFVENQVLGSGRIEILKKVNDDSETMTVRSTLKYLLKSGDHSKELKCVATHPGSLLNKSFARIQLFVNFRPLPQPDINIFGVKIGKSTVIGPITIQASPQPTFKWIIDGKVLDKFETGKFVFIQPIQIDVNRWNASLFVGELTSEDLTRKIQLNAVNYYGSTNFTVRLIEGSLF
jgi:CD80-like C2-set immunoglobulin domain